MPRLSPDSSAVLSVVTRSGFEESCHRGALAVWHEGDLHLSLGDSEAGVVCRSAVKPLQVLPTLERGVFDRLSLRDADLALACASHDGTPQHTEAVRAFLARAACAVRPGGAACDAGRR